jgi:Flp pilus assembly protein TadG
MKKVLFIILILVAVGVGAGLYMWNKAPDKVEDSASSAISADDLAVAFTTNEQQANAKYLNKVLDVSGTIVEVTKNQDGKTVITLGVASDPLSGVQCTMRENNVKAEAGKSITIKGFCNGYTLVVLLSDCIIK